jgi:hypothetical protein
MKKAALLAALLPGLASAQQTSTMKLSIQVENRILNANLIDSKTTRDFISLLPLTLTMNDLFGREKWGQLPRPISEDGTRVRSYDVGDVIYWSPSAPSRSFIVMTGSRFPRPASSSWADESGVEALAVPAPSR